MLAFALLFVYLLFNPLGMPVVALRHVNGTYTERNN